MSNPFLNKFITPYGVPPFDQIANEHFLPAIEKTIESARAEVNLIINENSPSFSNIIEALEGAGRDLDMVTDVLFNLNAAETNEELQKIAQEATPLLTKFDTEVKQNEPLFRKISDLYNEIDQLDLTVEQKTLLEKTYKSFIKSGAALGDKEKNRFEVISVELGRLALTFGENILAETNDFELVVSDEQDLSGLPKDVIARAAELAGSKGQDGKWMFTLQAPSYVPFMEYADNRELREHMYRAYMSKAFKGDERDNRQIIEQMVQLRQEKASLLGYKSYAELVLDERMAESPESVLQFIDDLLDKATPLAKKEKEEIEAYMRKLGVDHKLQRWDWAYYSEKFRKEKYDIDDELVKPFFKLENVIEGVFETASRLYGLQFLPNDEIPVYHQEVKAYEVRSQNDELYAIFLTDFFPREGKRPGAWMTSYRSQRKENGTRVAPIVSIVCNFSPSTATEPSLLKFDEVKTLFHEFGHALHGMLADTTYGSLSGTSVYWDFVELPSQIMENWCFEKECLALFAQHYKTGQQIPDEYIERLKTSSTYHEAYATLRQLSFGLLDMAYHHNKSDKAISVDHVEQEAMSGTDLFPRVDGTNMSVQFAHIFSGGYASGYYSYKWAEVLDADAFELFEEKGIFNPQVAGSFRDHVLSRGGTEHPMTLYKRFRGQAPSSDALLRRAGLTR